MVAHGNCVVNARYIRNCADAEYPLDGCRIGQALKISPKYLRRSIDVLTEFGILLMFTAFRKQYKTSDEALCDEINLSTYELIKSKRYQLAVSILEFVLEKQTVSIPESTRKMMTVNFANALRKAGDQSRSKRVLDSTDWSASSDNYKICVAALRDDIDEFIRLMPSVVSSKTVTNFAFREWPVFDWVRANERVKAEFERLFNEPLLVATDEDDQEQVDAVDNVLAFPGGDSAALDD